MTDELKILWQEMADHTKRVCMSGEPHEFGSGNCVRAGSCCSSEYCDMAMQIAEEEFHEPLTPTGHPTLPLMGPGGCIAPPHTRPLCTLHVCCINSIGFKPNDRQWTEKYFELRGKIERQDERC